MATEKTVLVAMSGGVDSSVAAGLLVRAGYAVRGVYMRLGQSRRPDGAARDEADAQAVAEKLNIELEIVDYRVHMEEIIRYFVDEYRRARTPNPCCMCNCQLKFGQLARWAGQRGITYLATGHYARISREGGAVRLCRAANREKDQSYALFGLDREVLNRVLLPNGDYSKEQIRRLAAEMSLPVHEKGESQEICFVADDDYAALIARRAPELVQKGPIVDTSGKVLGEHEGIFRYTIGQRRGLGVALGEPAYVVRLDAATNTVTLGSREELHQRRLWASQVNWLTDPPAEPFAATVQIRYNHAGAPATVTPEIKVSGTFISGVRVDFADSIAAITPGQAAVFYDDNQYVLGGGWIDKAEN